MWRIEKVEAESGEEALVVYMETNKANFFSLAMMDDMSATLDRLESDPDLQGFGVVLTVPKNRKVFSAGLDLKHVATLNMDTFNEYIRQFDALIWRLWKLKRPVVAAVGGHAMAGGFCLMSACDFRVGLEGSFQLGMNEVHMPAILPLGSTEICRYAMGDQLLKKLLLQGEFYTPDSAVELGILDAVEEDWDSMLQAALTRAALPGPAVPAFGQMKANLQAPVAVLADDAERNSKVFQDYYKKNPNPMGSKL